MQDPFAHHPDLRRMIKPAEASFFRDFSLEKLARVSEEHGVEPFPAYTDAEREVLRHAALCDRKQADLWVFAYGSLMWDPALEFAEVRRAYAPGYARRFILRDDYGGRGTRDAPGLMAALDEGDGCAGLAFRIAQSQLEAETDILFRREMLGPGYFARFVPVTIDETQVEALTFVADHDTDLIDGDLTREQQIRFLLTGKGFLGTSYDYLANVIAHLHDMDIPDPDLDALKAEVDARRVAQAG